MVKVPLVRLRLTSLRIVAVPEPLYGVIHMTKCTKVYTHIHLYSSHDWVCCQYNVVVISYEHQNTPITLRGGLTSLLRSTGTQTHIHTEDKCTVAKSDSSECNVTCTNSFKFNYFHISLFTCRGRKRYSDWSMGTCKSTHCSSSH